MIGIAVRNLAKYLFLGMVPLLLLAFPIVLIAQETSETDEGEEVDPQTRLEGLNEEEALLEHELSERRQAQNLALLELDDIDQELTSITERLAETTILQRRKQDQFELNSDIIARALEDLQEAQARFEARLVEWYKSGAGSMLSTLITTGDLSDFFHIISYMEALIINDQDIIDFINEQQGIILEQTRELEEDILESEILLAEMREEEARYQLLKESRRAQLTDIAGDVATRELALEELRASSYEIQMLLRASSYTGGSGGSMIPPVNTSIQSRFGMRRHPIFGGVRMHTGVDIPAAYGTPIHAALDGEVVFSGWKRGYGNTIVIQHSQNLATLYAHCSSLVVRVGEFVDRAQVIAKIGSTGYATGNHVHFEVRINGEPVDPEDYI